MLRNSKDYDSNFRSNCPLIYRYKKRDGIMPNNMALNLYRSDLLAIGNGENFDV